MELEQGNSYLFYATFADAYGEAATVTSGAVIISHVHGSTVVVDQAHADMTQKIGNTYYYKYHIPANADKTTYDVTYIGLYDDGTLAIGGEAFHVITRRFFDRVPGGFTKNVIVKDAWTEKDKDSIFGILAGMNKLLKSIEKVSEKDKTEEVKKDMRSLFSKFDNKVKIIENQFNLQAKDFDGMRLSMVTRLERISSQIDEDTPLEIKRIITAMNKTLSEKPNTEPDRLPRVIAELDDLQKKVEELRELYKMVIPESELKRMIQNGSAR